MYKKRLEFITDYFLSGANLDVAVHEQVIPSIKGKVILVTGAAGFIGSALVETLVKYQPHTILLFDQSEHGLFYAENKFGTSVKDTHLKYILGDVRNNSKIDSLFRIYKPHVIFHSAAYKHVHILERYPTEAVLTNVDGTRNLVEAAIKYSSDLFFFISTDKAVNPVSIMGASKLLAELYIQSLISNRERALKFVTSRFGNIVGSTGSVFPLFYNQIKSGGPVTITHQDIHRYFMTIEEACSLVFESILYAESGEIVAFDMGDEIRIYDIAEMLMEKLEEKVEIKFVGLREGERLAEDSLINYLSAHTPNSKIFKINNPPSQSELSKDVFDKLIRLAKEEKAMDVVEYIKKILPNFRSKNGST